MVNQGKTTVGALDLLSGCIAVNLQGFIVVESRWWWHFANGWSQPNARLKVRWGNYRWVKVLEIKKVGKKVLPVGLIEKEGT
jgi:hypothetical protein